MEYEFAHQEIRDLELIAKAAVDTCGLRSPMRRIPVASHQITSSEINDFSVMSIERLQLHCRIEINEYAHA